MTMRYGVNLLESDLKELIKRYDKQKDGTQTWQNLFDNLTNKYESGITSATDNYQTGINTALYQKDYGTHHLNKSYDDTISQAYTSAFDARNRIMSSGLNAGATQEYITKNYNNLEKAYGAFKDKYLAQKTDIDDKFTTQSRSLTDNYMNVLNKYAQEYQKGYDVLDTELTDRARNTKGLFDSVYKYLQDEAMHAKIDTKEGDKIVSKSFLENSGLSWALGEKETEDGTVSYLKSWNEIGDELFDAEGNLTKKGQDFYINLMHTKYAGFYRDIYDKDGLVQDTRAFRSFDEWLSDNNPELRDWWVSNDLYNGGKTNVDLSRDLIGAEQRAEEVVKENIAKEEAKREAEEKATNEPVKYTTKYGFDKKPFGEGLSPAIGQYVEILNEDGKVIKNAKIVSGAMDTTEKQIMKNYPDLKPGEIVKYGDNYYIRYKNTRFFKLENTRANREVFSTLSSIKNKELAAKPPVSGIKEERNAVANNLSFVTSKTGQKYATVYGITKGDFSKAKTAAIGQYIEIVDEDNNIAKRVKLSSEALSKTERQIMKNNPNLKPGEIVKHGKYYYICHKNNRFLRIENSSANNSFLSKLIGG